MDEIVLEILHAKVLPDSILHRRKHGFTVPLDSWFRKDLRELANDCFFADESILRYFSVPGLRKIWDEHQLHQADHGTLLWSLLMFALWQREYMTQ